MPFFSPPCLARLSFAFDSHRRMARSRAESTSMSASLSSFSMPSRPSTAKTPSTNASSSTSALLLEPGRCRPWLFSPDAPWLFSRAFLRCSPRLSCFTCLGKLSRKSGGVSILAMQSSFTARKMTSCLVHHVEIEPSSACHVSLSTAPSLRIAATLRHHLKPGSGGASAEGGGGFT